MRATSAQERLLITSRFVQSAYKRSQVYSSCLVFCEILREIFIGFILLEFDDKYGTMDKFQDQDFYIISYFC